MSELSLPPRGYRSSETADALAEADDPLEPFEELLLELTTPTRSAWRSTAVHIDNVRASLAAVEENTGDILFGDEDLNRDGRKFKGAYEGLARDYERVTMAAIVTRAQRTGVVLVSKSGTSPISEEQISGAADLRRRLTAGTGFTVRPDIGTGEVEVSETPDSAVTILGLIRAFVNAYQAQLEVSEVFTKRIQDDSHELASIAAWVRDTDEDDNGEFRQVLWALWADLHDEEAPSRFAEALEAVVESVEPEQYLDEFHQALAEGSDVEQINDTPTEHLRETLASLVEAARHYQGGELDEVSDRQIVEDLLDMWPPHVRTALAVFAAEYVQRQVQTILEATKRHGTDFRQTPSAEDVGLAYKAFVDFRDAKMNPPNSGRKRSPGPKRSGGKKGRTTRSTADINRSVEPDEEMSDVTAGLCRVVVSGGGQRLKLRAEKPEDEAELPDSIADMVSKFAEKHPFSYGTRAVNVAVTQMMKYVAEEPYGIGTKRIRPTSLRRLSPVRLPNLSTPGELRRVRIIFAVDRDREGNPVVGIEGVYTHDDFDTRVTQLLAA